MKCTKFRGKILNQLINVNISFIFTFSFRMLLMPLELVTGWRAIIACNLQPLAKESVWHAQITFPNDAAARVTPSSNQRALGKEGAAQIE